MIDLIRDCFVLSGDLLIPLLKTAGKKNYNIFHSWVLGSQIFIFHGEMEALHAPVCLLLEEKQGSCMLGINFFPQEKLALWSRGWYRGTS